MKKFMNLIPGAVWDDVRGEFVIVGELSEEFAEVVASAGEFFRNLGRDVHWMMFDPKGNIMVAYNADKQKLGSITPPGLQLIRLIDEHRHRFGLVTRFKMRHN
jgi:hypothetical protein